MSQKLFHHFYHTMSWLKWCSFKYIFDILRRFPLNFGVERGKVKVKFWMEVCCHRDFFRVRTARSLECIARDKNMFNSICYFGHYKFRLSDSQCLHDLCVELAWISLADLLCTIVIADVVRQLITIIWFVGFSQLHFAIKKQRKSYPCMLLCWMQPLWFECRTSQVQMNMTTVHKTA